MADTVDLASEFEAPAKVTAPESTPESTRTTNESVDLMSEYEPPPKADQHAIINDAADVAHQWKMAHAGDDSEIKAASLLDEWKGRLRFEINKMKDSPGIEAAVRNAINIPQISEKNIALLTATGDKKLPIIAGAYNAVAPIISSFTSPLGIGTLGVFGGLAKAAQGIGRVETAAKVALATLTGYFSAEMAKTAGGTAGKASVDVETGAPSAETAKDVTSAIAHSAMAILAGIGAAKEAIDLTKGELTNAHPIKSPAKEIRVNAEPAPSGSEMAGGVAREPVVAAGAPVAQEVQAVPEVVPQEAPVNIGDRSGRPTGAAEEAIVAEQKRLIDEHLAEQAKTAGKPVLADELTPPAEIVVPKEVPITTEPVERITGLKNADVDAQLKEMGLPETKGGEGLSFKEAAADAAKKLDVDPNAGVKLVSELSDNPRPITGEEDALLLSELVRRSNERNAAEAELNEAMNKNDPAAISQAQSRVKSAIEGYRVAAEADANAGTKNAVGLALRGMRMKQDFTLAAMERRRQAAQVSELTSEQLAETKALHDKIASTQKAFDDYVAANKPRRGTSNTDRNIISTFIAEKAAAARERIKVRALEGRVRSGLDPTELADYAIIGAEHIANGIENFSDWGNAMVKEFGEKLKPHLQAIFDKSKIESEDALLNARLEARKKRLEARVEELTKKVKSGDTSTESPSANRPSIEEIEKLEQQRDALQSELTGMRANEAKINELREAIAEKEGKIKEGNLSPKPTGVNRPAAPVVEKLKQQRDALNKDLAEARKEENKPDATEIQSRKVEELNRLISEKKAALKSGNVQPKRAELNRPQAQEIEEAKQEIETLNKEIAKNRVKEPVVGGPDKLSPEQIRLKSFKTRTTNRIEDLGRRVEEGDFSKKERVAFSKDAEANALQAKLDAAKEEYEAALERDRYEKLSNIQKAKEQGIGFYDMARTLMTTGEFSFVLRQGKMTALSHPIMTANALPAAFRALVSSPEAAHAINLEVLNHPDYAAAKAAKLHLLEHGQSLSKQEEILMAAQLAEKIPVIGKGARGFNQAAETFLNKLRFDLWRSMRDVGGLTAAEDKQLAKFVNESTGRGSLGAFEPAAVPLGRLMFSPRFFASRIQLLVGHSMWGGTPRARQIIAKEYARALVGMAAYYGAIELRNQFVDDKDKATIGTDPRSSDFGKIKIHNTRLDPLAGISQVIVFGSRMATGEKTNSKGKVTDIRGPRVPYGGEKSSEVALNFGRSKLHPVAGAVVNLFDGTDLAGNKATVANQALNLSGPLTWIDIYQALEEQDLPDGVALGLLAALGEGLQTYDPKHKRKK